MCPGHFRANSENNADKYIVLVSFWKVLEKFLGVFGKFCGRFFGQFLEWKNVNTKFLEGKNIEKSKFILVFLIFVILSFFIFI